MSDFEPEKTEYSPVELLAVWTTVTETFGEAAVTFVLGIDRGTLPEFHDGGRWSGILLLEYLAQFVPNDGPIEIQISSKVHCLTRIGSNAMTLAGEIRLCSGGQLPSTATDDPLLQQLVNLAFAGLAAEHIPGVEHNRFSLSAAFQDPTVLVPLCQAFMADKKLKKLFPNAPQTVDHSNYHDIIAVHYWALSGGGTTWLTIMLGNIIEQTLARMRWERNLREESLVTSLSQTLDALRQAADGQEIDIPVLAGLNGVAPSTDLRLEQGGLLLTHGLALDVFPGKTPPQSIAYVIVKDRLLTIRQNYAENSDQPDRDFANNGPKWQLASQQVRREFDRLRFWIVAWTAENARSNIKPTLTHWSVMNPAFKSNPIFDIGPTASASQQPLNTHGAVPTELLLDDSDLAGIAEISERLNHVPTQLSLGVSRIVRAAVERDDPMDSFVDAVIAWENLVGAKTETTFRVCGALAILLEPTDLARRIALLKSLKADYNKRSRLVHGGDEPKPGELGLLRDRALDVAIQAMKTVLQNAKLAGLKSSEERSDAILLGNGTDE